MGWRRERVSALNYSVNYLSYRPRSVAEVVSALRKKKYEPAEIDAAINELIEKGLLDDRSFTESWINFRKNQSIRSRSFVRQELRTKGVAASIIESSLEEYYPQEDEREVLLPLLERQWQNLNRKQASSDADDEDMELEADDEDRDNEEVVATATSFGWRRTDGCDPTRKITEKLMRKYAGKGFSPSLIRDVLAEVQAMAIEEE
ncbi:MAG: hypothetical protein HFI72_02940 [Peptococcaceae bacterium]|jgi:SOS response regulatory protein OraA/RecX|nr:hypothetical protein [Peptococcaceae bacterium]